MDTKQKITIGAIGILTVLSLVLASNLIAQENVYACLDREIAMICEDGLSNVNADGLQTRCKYFSEELNRSTYKICNSGWIKFENQESIKLNEIYDIKDYVCNNETIIKECIAEDGSIILRVGI